MATAERTAAGVDRWIDQRCEQLVELAAALVRFDTRAVAAGEANEEGACQAFLRDWLGELGASVERVLPDPARFAQHPMMPAGHRWDGREMTLAHVAGAGGGRSLILNGHVDVVSPEPLGAWSRDPFGGEVAEGRLWGRGAADMKGGLAAACFALRALAATGTRLDGDVWVQVVTDEETSGMGTVAMLAHAPPADAAICPEPTGLDAWVACRGVLYGRVVLEGRAGHAEGHQQDWRAGGGVSAIEKLRLVLEALERVNADWRVRREKRHPTLSRPRVVPTVVRGGEFVATFPATCALELDVTYLPADADEHGFGSRVRAELEAEVGYALAADPWLREHPARWEWLADFPPYDASDAGALGAALDAAVAPLGRTVRRRGLDSWHDAASIGLRHGIPAVSFGPGDPAQAHVVDESIALADLVTGAKALARALLAWCGCAAAGQRTRARPGPR